MVSNTGTTVRRRNAGRTVPRSGSMSYGPGAQGLSSSPEVVRAAARAWSKKKAAGCAPDLAWAMMRGRCRRNVTKLSTKEERVILATTTVEDYDRWLKVFSTNGAEKRKQHGSKGATVFRDPNEGDRVWVVFDWDAEGWQNFVSDPEVPAIFQEAGSKGKPQAAELGGHYDA